MTRRRVPAQPGLYRVDREAPVLLATRCAACETNFFPPLPLGCENCGAGEDLLAPIEIPAHGSVRSAATVHVHGGDDIEAPFVVGEIELGAGPLVRGILEGLGDLGDVEVIGRNVEGTWHVCGSDEAGDDVTELRFRLAPGAAT